MNGSSSLSLYSPYSTNLGRIYQQNHEGWWRVPDISEFNPRIHVVELAPLGFRYYRGSFESFEEAPPRYTWKKIDYRADDTVVYVDLNNPETDDRCLLH
jgi:hypothetical protein